MAGVELVNASAIAVTAAASAALSDVAAAASVTAPSIFAGSDTTPPSVLARVIAGQSANLRERNATFIADPSPHVLLLSIHGYVGPKVPFGATDTGGQIVYIQRKALELTRLGYKVTVATRAFLSPADLAPFGDRRGVAFAPEGNDKIRYLFVGGMEGYRAHFLPKEDIYRDLPAIARSLAQYAAEEAALRNLKPWEYFAWVESHYVDAGIVAQRLIRTWAHEIAARYLAERFSAVLKNELRLDALKAEHNLMGALAYHFGNAVLHVWHEETRRNGETQLKDVLTWAATKLGWPKLQRTRLLEGATRGGLAPQRLAYEVGSRLIHTAGIAEDLDRILSQINRHVFTPHSLGTLKEERMIASGDADRSPETFLAMNFPVRENAERTLLAGAAVLYANLPPAAVVVATSDELTDAAFQLGTPATRPVIRYEPGTDGDIYHPRESLNDASVAELLTHLETTGAVPGPIIERLRSRPQDFNIVIEAGRMADTKRKHILIHAMRALPDNTLLFIAGSRDKTGVYDGLAAEIEGFGLQNRVFLLGMVPSHLMGPLMGLPHGEGERRFRLAVIASASRMEGWGMAVQEGTMGGLPLVASSYVPYAVHLQNARNAAVVIPVLASDEATEAEQYAQALQGWIDSPAAARVIASRSLAAAREYEWGALTRRYAGQVTGLLQGDMGGGAKESAHPRVHLVLLAGGLGIRVVTPNNARESETPTVLTDVNRALLQAGVEHLGGGNVWVSTTSLHAPSLPNQVPGLLRVNVFREPFSRGTAPAAAAVMYRIARQDPQSVTVVMPHDHPVRNSDAFFKSITAEASDIAVSGAMVTFGSGVFAWNVQTFLNHLRMIQPVVYAGLEAVFGRLSTETPVPPGAMKRFLRSLRPLSIENDLIRPAAAEGHVTVMPLQPAWENSSYETVPAAARGASR